MPPVGRRRLRLEFLEDRSLPAVQVSAGGAVADPPDSTTPARTADTSPDTASEATEYQTGSQSAATANPSSGPVATGKTTYTDETNSASRTSAGATPRTPVAVSEADEYATSARPTTATAAPVAAAAAVLPPVPVTVPAGATVTGTPVSTGSTAVPPGPTMAGPSTIAGPAGSPPASPAAASTEAEEPPAPTPTPVSAGTEAPAVAAADPLLTSPAAALARWVDDLAVRVDLPAGWDEAAARLLDGLAAAADDPADPETGWVRLGYWVVSVAAVGVAVELSGRRSGAAGRTPTLTPRPVWW